MLLALCAVAAYAVYLARRGPAPPPEALTATVLPEARQTLKGWGIYPSTIQLDRPDANNFHIFNRPNAQRLIFRELGLSFFRTELLPGSYDARRDDGSLDTAYLDGSLVRMLRLARSYNHDKYILSVWSPPAPMKDPVTTRGQAKTVVSRLRPDREDAYCQYIVHALDYVTRTRHLAAPFAFSIQNEPGASPVLWNGTVYDGPQWRRVFKKMRGALDAGGYRAVKLIGPEADNYWLSYDLLGGPALPELKKDPALVEALSGFAYHGYGTNSHLAPFPQQLRSAAETARGLGKDVWMTEWSITYLREPMDHTLDVAQRLGRETAYIPTNYWTWFQGWYFQHPKGEVLLTGADDEHLHITKTYYFLRKLWHSAPAGSVVHRVRTDDANIRGYDADKVQTVAFEGGGRLTVMLVNPTGRRRTVMLRGLEKGAALVYVTDAARDMALAARLPVREGALSVDLPPRSVVLAVVRTKRQARPNLALNEGETRGRQTQKRAYSGIL